MNRVIAALTLLLFTHLPGGAQETGAVLHRCWTPEQLAGKASEKASIRRRIALDRPALRALSAAEDVPTLPGTMRGSIRSVKIPDGRKLIALTFDLCETPYSIAGYDGQLVDYLRENRIRATFFASGKWFETHSERAQQLLADPMFEIGSHGLEHRDSRRLGGKSLTEEIRLSQSSYHRTREKLGQRACLVTASGDTKHTVSDPLRDIPKRISLFRFPYGTCTANSLKAVGDAGLLAIQWDVVSGDPEKTRSARAIAATVVSRARPGSIVVAHANGRGWNTASALPLIIPKLKEQGYEFVTVSELLAAGEPVIAQSCYEHTPGDHRNFHLSANSAPKKKAKAKNAISVFHQTAD